MELGAINWENGLHWLTHVCRKENLLLFVFFLLPHCFSVNKKRQRQGEKCFPRLYDFMTSCALAGGKREGLLFFVPDLETGFALVHLVEMFEIV